ncbi:MAG: flagellar biosynthetic protein FliO [Colwellia sp.]|nr:flagellar biosynthetic protein FliO [Colwellia sp.]
MINRSLALLFFLLVSFSGIAQENSLTKVGVENIVEDKTTAITAPKNIEVGRHVMGNMDAGSMIVSLLLVLFAIVIAAWLLKKLQVGGNTVNGLKVVTSLNLGSKERLVVVQIGEKQLLLGITGQQINLLDTLDEPIEIKSGVPIELSQTLARFTRKPS